MTEFNSIFDAMFGPGTPKPAPSAKPTAKPMPQIRGRVEGDVLWVRAEDVADALDALAPTVNARLVAKLRRKP